MKLLFRFLCLFIVLPLTSLSFQSCDSDNDSDDMKVENVLKDGLIKITKNIGEWDEGIVFDKDGFIVTKNPSAGESSLYMQIMNPEDDFDCAITSDDTSCIPTSLSFPDRTYYFDNVGDSVIVLSKSSADGIEYVDSIPVQIQGVSKSGSSSKFTTISFVNRDDKVHKVVKALDAILEAGDGYTTSQLRTLKKNLDKISPFYYYENVESILDKLDLCRTENEETNDIIYCFTQYATKVKIVTYDPIKYAISVRTERTATEVFGTSAVVGGGIYCASDHFKEKGEWGIILSKNPSNLSLDNFERCVYATEKNFRVEFDNLEPNTTYYYKTFYKYKNSNDHGDLVFSYGNKNADSYVDADFFKGEFTTGNPGIKVLSVYNLFSPYFDPVVSGGIIYPALKLEWKDVKYFYGSTSIFKNEPEFYYSGKGETPSYIYINELSEWDYNWTDKWNFDTWTVGTNSFKLRIYITSRGNYIETEWIDFRYDWTNGITLIK